MNRPPPPPPALPQLRNSNAISTNDKLLFKAAKLTQESVSFEEEIAKLWRLHWIHVTQGEEDVSVYYIYNGVQSIRQEGPTCGLVALTMAANVINEDKQASEVNSLLVEARAKGYSKRGEMFSASDMATLCETHFNLNTEIKQNLQGNKMHSIIHLWKGYPILVPYDADYNDEPGLRGGRSAHWATLLGFCLVVKNNRFDHNNTSTCRDDQINENVIRLRKEDLPDSALLHVIENEEYLKLFLFAKQGRSVHLQLFEFNQLCESNCNLVDYNRDKTEFVYPINGLREALCNRSIFIKPK